MFDINQYYKQAHSGECVENTALLNYIKSFPQVVLWGGSFLGDAVGKYLLENGVNILNYWDLRADSIQSVNGIQCVQPFTTDQKNETLVIFCIGNNVIRGLLLEELSEKGYKNVIRGDYLYMGAICPFDKTTDIESNQCQGSMCCRFIFCQRLSNIVKSRNPSKDLLHTFSITLIINQRCSLKCKCCTSYMNEYPLKERIDIPLDRICDDIDKFFDAMDSIGTVTVMGGEPFMHPDLSKIIQKLLSKHNFGLISIATSGTYPIKPEQLEGLDDKRINVSFSNYEHAINEKQKEMMYRNIELIKNAGISYTVGVTIPEWSVPSTLYDLHDTEEQMIAKKADCVPPLRCMQVKNGKLHPCDFATALYSLDLGRYEMDYVDIEHSTSKEELKEAIRAFIEQPYYRTCGHCAGMQGLTSKAAEQGYMDFKKPIVSEKV